MLFSHKKVGSAQWTLPTTIKRHTVKIVIMWSIPPDENFNIGLVYIHLNTMFTLFQIFGHLAFNKKQITELML